MVKAIKLENRKTYNMLFSHLNIQTTSVNKFVFIRPRLLIGPLLQDVKALQNSITRFGLLSPIIIRKHQGRLIVVDGRKRLLAIRRLSFTGQLPRSLVNISYIELKNVKAGESPIPALMSNRELYATVSKAFLAGQSLEHIAEDLYLSRRCIAQILTLSRLAPRLRALFFERVINFDQARHYAAQPNRAIQTAIFGALGPFASVDDIRLAMQDISDHQDQPAAQRHIQPMLRVA